MKIAFIGQKGIPSSYGGVERHVEELATRLAKNPQNQVFVYCRRWYTSQSKNEKVKSKNLQKLKNSLSTGETRNQKPILIFIPSLKTKNLDTISHVFFSTLHALTQPYNIIHYQGIGPALLAFIPRLLKPKTRVIVTYHCADYEHQKWGFLARFMLKMGEIASLYFPHQTIVVSQTIQKQLEQKYHKPISYIPNGVTLPSPTRIKNKTSLKKWNLQPNEYLLSVNRLVRHKGIHLLIEAYQNLYPKPSEKDKKLVIVGDSAFTNDYVQELKALAYGNPNIIFTGYQTGKNLANLFNHAYLYVQPSESEGLPISVLEALSFENPVLASNINANKEILKGFGLYFQKLNALDLQKKLQYSLKHPQILQKIKQNSHKMLEKNYNWDKITASTEFLYQCQKLTTSSVKTNKKLNFGPLFEIPSFRKV